MSNSIKILFIIPKSRFEIAFGVYIIYKICRSSNQRNDKMLNILLN